MWATVRGKETADSLSMATPRDSGGCQTLRSSDKASVEGIGAESSGVPLLYSAVLIMQMWNWIDPLPNKSIEGTSVISVVCTIESVESKHSGGLIAILATGCFQKATNKSIPLEALKWIRTRTAGEADRYGSGPIVQRLLQRPANQEVSIQ